MIRVSLDFLLLLYLSLGLALFALFWALSHQKERKREKAFQKKLTRCRSCAFLMKDDVALEKIKCPRCGIVNLPVEAKIL